MGGVNKQGSLAAFLDEQMTKKTSVNSRTFVRNRFKQFSLYKLVNARVVQSLLVMENETLRCPILCLFIRDGIVYPRPESLKMEIANDGRANEWAIKTKPEPALNEPFTKVGGGKLGREQDTPYQCVEPLEPYKFTSLARIRVLIAAKMIPTHHCGTGLGPKRVLLPKAACGKSFRGLSL